MEPIMAVRIGELSRRVGVSTHTLRAWERRYGLLHPVRSASGYRMYDPADERRIRAVVEARQRGVPVSIAVRQVLQDGRGTPPEPGANADSPPGTTHAHSGYVQALHDAADCFDESAMHAVWDDMFTALPLGDILDDVLMPFLQQLGQRWADGGASVACEHFASQLIRRRLGALTLAWGNAHGPAAVLACPSGEQHDIALLCYGLLLGRSGWRVHYLGTDTPAPDVLEVAASVRPSCIVLAATREDLLAAALSSVTGNAHAPVFIAGEGASRELAGATPLPRRLQDAVIEITRSLGHGTSTG